MIAGKIGYKDIITKKPDSFKGLKLPCTLH